MATTQVVRKMVLALLLIVHCSPVWSKDLMVYCSTNWKSLGEVGKTWVALSLKTKKGGSHEMGKTVS